MTARLKRFGLLLLAGIALSACSSLGTVVDESDPETEVPNMSMGRALFEGLGAVPTRRTAINYSPRAPLVVPPNTSALAAPEQDTTVANTADWPDDPDLATARRLREAERRADARGDKGKPIEPSELLAERVPPSARDSGWREENDPARGRPVLPRELARPMGSAPGGDGLYDANGQPQRRALVEPPVQYLQPAPGVPVVVPEEEPSKKGLLSWF